MIILMSESFFVMCKSQRCVDKELDVERTRLAIIGAGIAGIAAAKTLEEHDFHDYILLEAQDYVGGRIKSIPWNNNWIEEGAQFLHGDESTFAKICLKNGLISEEESREGEGIYVRSDGLHVDQKLIGEIDNLVRDTLEECEKFVEESDEIVNIPSNIGSTLREEMDKLLIRNQDKKLTKLKEEIYDWNVRFLLIDNSCENLNNLSAKNWGRFEFVGGSEHLIFKEGYSSAVKLISQDFKRNLRLKSPVRKIEWKKIIPEGSKAITLILDDEEVHADCVLVTPSLGYLKENPEIFFPHLPNDLCLGIESLGFGLINKVFLDFGEPWWEPGIKGIQLIWHENNKDDEVLEKLALWTRDLTGFDVLQDHEAVLLGWVGGKGAKIIEDLTNDEVRNDCIDLLRFFLKNDNLPEPKRCKKSQWGKNEFVRGSYSNISTKCDKNGISPKSLARPVWGTMTGKNESKNVPVLMLAGEAVHDKFYSTTHGAFESGKNQALKFLKHHVSQQ